MNPIYTSEILKDDNIDELINKYKKLSDQFKSSINDMRSEAVLLNTSISQSAVNTSMHQDEVKKTATEIEKLTAAYLKTKKELDAVNAKLKALTEAKKQNTAASKAEEKVNNSVAGSLNNLKAQLALNKAKLNEMTEAQKKNSAEGYKLQQQTDKLALRIANLTAQENENLKIKKLQSIASKSAEGSFAQLSAQYQLATIQLNKMSEEERKNTKAGQDMEAQSKRIYEEMKRLQAATGAHTLNVGNYSGALAPLLSKQKQLVQQLAQVRSEFSSLPAHVQKNSQAHEYHSKVVDSLTKEIRELEAVTGRQITANDQNAGSINKVYQSAKNLLGVYFGLSALQGVKDTIFGQTKEIDSLDKAYEKIIPNTQKLGRANDFLGRLSESYGLNLIKLRGEYLKYTAAAQSSTLSLKDQELVFESVAKASSTLGLSTETQSRAFTALQQIMSKGKVSAEELKGQLGDALPGAVNIMAKALGVGVGELSKMLEQGQVLADEALPKFAIELQKAYGVEGVTTIDNLSSAQSRYDTEITKLIQRLDASDAFKNLFNTLASGVKFISDNIEAVFFLTKAVTLAAVAYGTWRVSLAISNSLLIQNALGSASAAASQGLLNTSVLLGKKAFDALKVAISTNPIGALATVLLTVTSAFVLFNDEVEKSGKLQKDLSSETQKRLVSEKVELERLLSIAKNEALSKEVRQKAISKLNEISPEYLGNLKLETINTNEAKAATDKYIESLELRVRIKAAEELLVEAEKKRIEDVNNGLDTQLTTWQKIKNSVLSFGNVGVRVGLDVTDGIKNSVKANKEYIDQVNYLKSVIGDGVTLLETENNITTTTTTNTKTKNDDPYKIFELQIEAMQDGYDKDLALLKLNNEKKKNEFKKYGLDTKVLIENFNIDKAKLDKKYADLETENFDNNFKEKLSYLEEGIEKEKTALFFEYSVKARTTKDKAALDKWYFAEYEKLLEKQKKQDEQIIDENISKAQKLYEEELQFAALEFSLTKRTEEEKKNFAIEQEKLKLQKILELNKQFNGNLTELQIKTIEAQIKTLEQGTKGYNDGTKKEKQSIYDVLGIEISQEKQQAFTDSLGYAKEQFSEWAQLRTDIAQQNIDTIANEIDSIENRLQVEIENRNANRAHNVETVTKELQDAKKAQEQALRERKKAQQAELLIQSVEQASNLVTASAKIWGSLGFPLAIPAIGLMWGSFIASKAQAFNLTKKAYGDGGYEEFDYGDSHASGNDIHLGYTKDGKDRRVEKGETMAIFNKRSVSKYGGVIKSIVNDINKGNLEKYIENQTRSGSIEVQNNIHKEILPIFAPSNDMRNVENELVKIRKQNEVKGAVYFTDRDGKIVKQYKNLITRYV